MCTHARAFAIFELDDGITPAADEWEEFRYRDGDPIGIEELKSLDLERRLEDNFTRLAPS